jgi:phytoene dehydrogenase-like protein
MADKPQFDVAVVGGGIGGLTTACLVARTGRSVILLERAGQAGGVCRPLVREGMRFDLGPTFLSGLQPGEPVGMLCQRLGLELRTTPCEPPFQVALPGHRLSLYTTPQAWAREIRRECPGEEAAWGALWAELDALESERSRLRQALPPLPPRGWRDRLRLWRRAGSRGGRLRQAMGTAFHATVERHGLGTIGRRILEACLWFLALRTPEECSTLEALRALQPLRRGGLSLAGGAGALVDALVARLERDGGQLRLGTAVDHLLAERGSVHGVVTAEQEVIRARVVVTDTPPTGLTPGLLPERRGFLRRSGTLGGPWQAEIGTQVLALALPGAEVPSALAGHCFVVHRPAEEASNENLSIVRLSPLPADGADGDLRVLTVSRFLGGEARGREGDPSGELFDALEELIPGVRERAVSPQLFGPAALGELWGRPAGAVRYAPESRDWLGQRGAAHEVGWPGLFVVGDWTFPGRLIVDVVEGATEVADTVIRMR